MWFIWLHIVLIPGDVFKDVYYLLFGEAMFKS